MRLACLTAASTAGEEHRLSARAGDLFDLSAEHRPRGYRHAVVPRDADTGPFGIASDEFSERDLERVLVVHHVHAAHAERAHQRRLRGRLCRITGLQAAERAPPAGVEALGLVLARVERGGEPHVGTPGADLQDAGGIDQRQRDSGRDRAVLAQIGDRARVLRRHLGIGSGDPGVELAGARVRVIERHEAHAQAPHVTAGVGQREPLAVDHFLGDLRRGSLQRQARVDRQLAARRFRGAGDADAPAARRRCGDHDQSSEAGPARAHRGS